MFGIFSFLIVVKKILGDKDVQECFFKEGIGCFWLRLKIAITNKVDFV